MRKFLKRFLSLALTFAMISSLIVVNVVDVAASTSDTDANGDPVSVWGGENDVSDGLAGSGTADDPYLIQSAADLAFLAKDINGGKTDQLLGKGTARYVGKYIVQTVNIDLGGHEWTPIGTDCDYGTFCGVYDGRGHYIKNMKIAEVHGLSHGLFGYLGDSGKQVTLAKGDVCGITNLTLSGTITSANNRVGGLVGQIHNRGHMDEGTMAYITNITCNVTIELNGANGGKNTAVGEDVDNKYYWGGVAGISNFALFENVVNGGSISATNCNSNHPIGGMIGRATRTELIDCINNGDVKLATDLLGSNWSGTSSSGYDQKLSGTLRAGGIVGQYTKIDNTDYLIFNTCVNNGNVSAHEDGSGERVHAGGILGSLTYLSDPATEGGINYSDYNLEFINCANTGEISATRSGGTRDDSETNAGGIIGTLYHGVGTEKNNAGGIIFDGCVNTGNISSTDVSGEIFGVLHNERGVIIGITIKDCETKGGKGIDDVGSFTYEANRTAVESIATGSWGTANESDVKSIENSTTISTREIGGFPTWGIGGLGSAESPFRIRNVKELLTFAKLVNDNGERFEGIYVVQENTINLDGYTWTPIGKDPEKSFLGVYDGKDNAINNMNSFADGLTSIGFFGYIGKTDSNTTLQYDCGVANLTVNGAISKGANYVGGVVGKINDESYVGNEFKAYVINTVSRVNINISNYGADLEETLATPFGGIAGYASSAVFENVTNEGKITVTGATHVYAPVGGIVGRAEHVEMLECKNKAAISYDTTLLATTTNLLESTVRVGGIVGMIYKTSQDQVQNFINCWNEGSVTAEMKTAATGRKVFAGGIVGGVAYKDSIAYTGVYDWSDGNTVTWRNYRTWFLNCYNKGSISAKKTASDDHSNAAGILGSAYPGGGPGQNHGGFKFEGCANSGPISATNTNRAAGITQAVWTTKDTYDYEISFESCATYEGNTYGKRLVGFGAWQIKTPQATVEEKNSINNTAAANNISAKVAAFIEPLSSIDINDFPTGVKDTSSDTTESVYLLGSGTKNDPFLIRSAADLKLFAKLSNEGKDAGNSTNYQGNYFTQTTDIDLSGFDNWTPISAKAWNSFLGIYDGKGYTISNMKITSADGNASLGLFGYVGTGGSNQVQITNDCGIANLKLTGSINVGKDRVGGLVGQINHRFYVGETYKVYITNVTCTVNITIQNYTSVGGGDNKNEVDNRHYIGGVAGIANGAVFENVVNEGALTVTGAFADHPVGGIVGRAANTELISCKNEGAVSVKTDFTYVDPAVDINGDGNVNESDYVYGIARAGGIVGLYLKRDANEWISFENCTNDAPISVEVPDANANIRVHAGGILGSLRYYGLNRLLNPSYSGSGAGKTYSDYNITIDGCVNKGAISATTAGTNEANAGGIVGTLYQGSGGAENNAGNIKIYECVNFGAVYSSSANRSAGIAGVLYTEGVYTYGVEIFGCMTGTDANTCKTIVAFVAKSGNAADALPQDDIAQNCETNSANATKLEKWNTDLMAPSLENIDGMPTAANVAVVRGLENTYVDLNEGASPVSDKLIILNEAGERVTILDKPGVYRYVLVFHGAQAYIADTIELYYNVTCDAQFAKEAGVSIAIQDDTFISSIVDKDGTPLNTYTTYGKTGAYKTRFLAERILPQQFTETIYTTISYNGKNVYNYEYAVAVYALNLLKTTAAELTKSTGEEWTTAKKNALDTLLVNLFRYAEEAQKLRWFPKEKYATNYLNEAQKALAVNATKEELTGRILELTYDDAYKDKYLPSNEIFVWKGAKLSYDHNVIMRIELKTKPEVTTGYSAEARIVRKDSQGNILKEYKVKDCGFKDTYVYVEGFTPLNYDCEVIIDIYDANGNKAAMTVHYSVNTYIYNRWSADVYSPLVQALAHYSKSAIAFINAN